MTSLHERPDNPVVGQTMPHESAALHVTGHALYTDDLHPRSQQVLHAHPVQAPFAHARITRLDPAPAYDVPGVNDSGIKHDEPLFPSEVMYYGHAVCWVLGESLEAARRGALATEAALEGRPWSAETVAAAAEVLVGEGTPISDQRASAAYRAAMLGQSLRKLWAEGRS